MKCRVDPDTLEWSVALSAQERRQLRNALQVLREAGYYLQGTELAGELDSAEVAIGTLLRGKPE